MRDVRLAPLPFVLARSSRCSLPRACCAAQMALRASIFAALAFGTAQVMGHAYVTTVWWAPPSSASFRGPTLTVAYKGSTAKTRGIARRSVRPPPTVRDPPLFCRNRKTHLCLAQCGSLRQTRRSQTCRRPILRVRYFEDGRDPIEADLLAHQAILAVRHPSAASSRWHRATLLSPNVRYC